MDASHSALDFYVDAFIGLSRPWGIRQTSAPSGSAAFML